MPKYKVLVRTSVIAEIFVTYNSGYSEETRRQNVANLVTRERSRALRRARRPITGGEFEVLSVERTVEKGTGSTDA